MQFSWSFFVKQHCINNNMKNLIERNSRKGTADFYEKSRLCTPQELLKFLGRKGLKYDVKRIT